MCKKSSTASLSQYSRTPGFVCLQAAGLTEALTNSSLEATVLAPTSER